MAEQSESYQVVPFPKTRRLMEDGGRLARQKHLIHGLFELDVTEARRAMRDHRAATGESLSLTAFVIACLGQAVDKDKSVQACRTWRERLVIFDDVDVNTLFEVEVDGRKTIRPHVIRAANKKTARAIHEEIRAFQTGHAASQEARFIEKFVLLPGFVRRLFLRVLLRSPQRLKAMNGTVALTSVGMFGAGGGWGLPVSNHTLQITLGGIAVRPALLDGQVVERQYLCVTISVDHDIVDGAPAARFAQSLKELVEGRSVLDELIGQGATSSKHNAQCLRRS